MVGGPSMIYEKIYAIMIVTNHAKLCCNRMRLGLGWLDKILS
jgi:hypothetical protein